MLWRSSWMLTLPVSVFFLVWVINTGNQYYSFAIKYDTAPVVTTLHNLGTAEFKYWVKSIGARAKPQRHSAYPKWRNIHLYVPESNLRQLNGNLPTSGFKYVKGKILNGEKLTKIKIRYRGDNAWHWAGHQKSIRIKTSKKRLFDGMRKFNLIIPKTRDQVSEYLSYRLANSMDLVAPKVEMVNVFINGKYDGTRMLVEQLDELSLRRQNLLPGDLYSGELIGRDIHVGANGNLFDNPGLWQKSAVNNHYKEDSFAPLKRLTDLLATPESQAKHVALAQLLDLEYWGLFSAFEVLSQGQHYNNSHNWRLYYDPSKGKFIPLVWDPMGWYLRYFPYFERVADLDILTSDLHTVLYQNADFIRYRNRAIDAFFRSKKDEAFLVEVAEIIPDAIKSIDVSPNLLYMTAFSDATKNLSNSISETFQYIESQYFPANQGRKNNDAIHSFYDASLSRLSLSIQDRDVITAIQLRYDLPIRQTPEVVMSYGQRGGEGVVDSTAIDPISSDKMTIKLATNLIANYTIKHDPSLWPAQKTIDVSSMTYQYSLSGLPAKAKLVEVKVFGIQGRERKVVEQQAALSMTEFKHFDSNLFDESQRGLEDREPKVKLPEEWSGKVVIDGLRYVNFPVTILPGTEIIMKEKAVLIFNNKVTVVGTSDNKIRIRRESPNSQPWGSVVLRGKGSRDSIFKHCEVTGGSGYKTPLTEYSGMFSIHNTQGIRIESCTFSNSSLVDDMVHIVFSEVNISKSVFTDSYSDALDIDISQVSITDSQFIRSGNDAVDLMNSQAVISGATFSQSGDKGLSVGENSQLVLANTVLDGNQIAIQTKDKSIAYVFNTEFVNNRTGVDCYKKNWQYGDGGHAFIFKSVFQGNNVALKSDKKSSIQVVDTFLGEGKVVENQYKHPRIQIDDLSSSKGIASPRDAENQENSLGMSTAPPFIESAFQRLSDEKHISIKTRGVFHEAF